MAMARADLIKTAAAAHLLSCCVDRLLSAPDDEIARWRVKRVADMLFVTTQGKMSDRDQQAFSDAYQSMMCALDSCGLGV